MLIFSAVCSFSCSNAQVRDTDKGFHLPEVPATLILPEDRAAHLSLHYWDHFDFKNKDLIDTPDIAEQAYVDFLSILPYTDKAEEAVAELYKRAAVEKEMLVYFMNLGDKYLYQPNSPMHNEDYHIMQLRAVIASPALDEHEKLRPRYMLETALKNRPGDIAADFGFSLRGGGRQKLSEIEADCLLIYFNDPDCDDCRRVKDLLASSSVINEHLSSGKLKILSVCVEGKSEAWENATFPTGWIDACDENKLLTEEQIYDLKAMPTLYLLDKSKRVLLKDAPPERIEDRLISHQLP